MNNFTIFKTKKMYSSLKQKDLLCSLVITNDAWRVFEFWISVLTQKHFEDLNKTEYDEM